MIPNRSAPCRQLKKKSMYPNDTVNMMIVAGMVLLIARLSAAAASVVVIASSMGRRRAVNEVANISGVLLSTKARSWLLWSSTEGLVHNPHVCRQFFPVNSPLHGVPGGFVGSQSIGEHGDRPAGMWPGQHIIHGKGHASTSLHAGGDGSGGCCNDFRSSCPPRSSRLLSRSLYSFGTSCSLRRRLRTDPAARTGGKEGGI